MQSYKKIEDTKELDDMIKILMLDPTDPQSEDYARRQLAERPTENFASENLMWKNIFWQVVTVFTIAVAHVNRDKDDW